MSQADPMTNRLDGLVVVLSFLLVGGGMVALTVAQIPDKNLPILASMLAGVLGFITAYVGFRFGSSVTAKRLAGGGADQ